MAGPDSACDSLFLLLQHPSDLHKVTSRENSNPFFFFIASLSPRKRDGLLGTGTEWEGDDRLKARPRKPPEKRPERPWTAARRMEVLRRCPLAIVQGTCALRNCCFNGCAGQSHKDNVRCTAVDEQLGQLQVKEVQLVQPSSTSLLMISSGLT